MAGTRNNRELCKIVEHRLEEPDLRRADGTAFGSPHSMVPNTPDRMLSICAINFEMYSFIRAFSHQTKD